MLPWTPSLSAATADIMPWATLKKRAAVCWPGTLSTSDDGGHHQARPRPNHEPSTVSLSSKRSHLIKANSTRKNTFHKTQPERMIPSAPKRGSSRKVKW